MNQFDLIAQDTRIKWYFTFAVFILFLCWCGGCAAATCFWLLKNPLTTQSLVTAAGLGGVTGAWIVWLGQIISYWFRKRPEFPQGGSSA